MSWLGPLFGFETMRQSRKSWTHWVRIVYCAMLFQFLYFVLGDDSKNTPGEIPRIAEACAQGYVTLQYLAVLLLTPIYVVSSIIEDRQKRVYEMLLTTELSSQEILLGKLLSRLVQVLSVLLCGIPILAMLQVFGGVNMQFVLWHSALALVLLNVLGALAIRAATWASTVLTGVLFTLLLLLPGIVVGSISWFFTANWDSSLLLFLFASMLLGQRMMKHSAISIDRREPTFLEQEKEQIPTLALPLEEFPDLEQREKLAQVHEYQVRRKREHFSHTIEPVSDRAHYWKEVNFPPMEMGYWAPAGFMIFPGLLACFSPWQVVFFFFMKALLLYYLYSVSVHLLKGYLDDRENSRLDVLATLPGERDELVLERFKGACFRFRYLVFNIILGSGLLVLFNPPHFWANLPLGILQLMFWGMFATWLGLLMLNGFVSKLFLGGWLIISSLCGYYLVDVMGVAVFRLPPMEQILLCLLSPWSLWSAFHQFDSQRQHAQEENYRWMLMMLYYGCILCFLALVMYGLVLRRLRRMYA